MRLKRLKIDRLPGIDQPFEIESPDAGVHVIFGPNAIGKSSICRAVEALYWDDRGPTERTSLTAQFELEGETWRAEREGARLRWRCEDGDGVRPGIPGSRHHRCFFLRLRDLIDPSLDGTQDVASEIRRQMSGGFDLHRIVDTYFSGISGRHGRRQRDEFNAAAREVQATEGNQSELQRREDGLGALKSHLDAAATGVRRLPSVKRAIGLAGRLEEYETIREKIAALPDALASLTGQELGQIEQHRERIVELDIRIRDLERDRDAAGDTARESRLTTEVNPAELTIWRQNAEELARVELDLQNARTHRGECKREVESALSSLGGGDVDEVALTLKEHERLFEFLRAASEHRTQRSAIEWRLRLLESIEQSEDGESRLVELHAALDLLRRWLRAPETETLRDRLRARRVWILITVAFAVLGAAMSVYLDPRFGLLLTAGAGVLVPVFLLRSTNPASTARPQAEEAFVRLAVDAPDEWNAGSVEARLRSLEADSVSIESRLRRARDRDGDRQSLNSQLDQLDEVKASLDEQRDSLLKSLKLDSPRRDAELVDFARAVDQLRATRIKYEGAAGRVDELESTHSALLSGLADVLEQHGEPLPEDATTAKAYLAALSDRNARLIRALADERQANTQLDQNFADRKEVLESIGQIYATASVEDGDVAGLTGLLDMLPRHRELQQRATILLGQISLDREELAKAGETALADLDGASLERVEHDLAAAADMIDGLRGEIADVNAQVNEAKRGTGLQELIARRENARTELKHRRDKALFAGAGTFLVDAVEREYEATQMPRVFERASGHFSAFTHHSYELRLGRDTDAPRLQAIELRSGESRELDELSDGTRAQLLLAARMAFAEELEQGITLPLFLDEALDQSDPDRFEAIARSLGRVANDQGRQIFYLTTDHLDGDRIRYALEAEDCLVAREIDLGSLRDRAAGVRQSSALRVPTRPGIPSPDGVAPEEYGVTLGVPRFTPARGYSEQHLFYLLPDDLDLLHALLTNGIEHAGQWKTVSGTALAEKLAARSKTSLEIGARIGLLQVFCELWNQGKGRIVDRDVLVQSRALSDKYLDHVVEIAGDLDGDADALIATVLARKDPRLKGFRRSSAEALEEYLRDHGYLDDRPVLDESNLRFRALSSPPANQLPDGVADACLDRWWVWAEKMPASS